MRSLWFVSICLLLAACTSIKPRGIRSCEMQSDPGKPAQVACHVSRVTRYNPPDSTHIFKASLDIKKHHLSGLLLIKRMHPVSGQGEPTLNLPSYRIVFMNEVGMTFFDLEMKSDSLRVVSCFPSLEKKALLAILETDLRILLWHGTPADEKYYLQEKTGNFVISGKNGPYKLWQTWTPTGDTLLGTAAKSTLSDPVLITYEKYTNGQPARIVLENPFIGMKIVLKRLGN